MDADLAVKCIVYGLLGIAAGLAFVFVAAAVSTVAVPFIGRWANSIRGRR